MNHSQTQTETSNTNITASQTIPASHTQIEVRTNNPEQEQPRASTSQENFTDSEIESWEIQEDYQEDLENAYRSRQIHQPVIHEKLPEIEAKLYLERNIGFFVIMGILSLCLFLFMEGYLTSNFLFFPIYVYLAYHLYETKKRRACANREEWRVKEDFFSILDNLNMMFFVASVQLIQLNLMNTCNIIFILHFFTTVLYYWISSAPQATKMTRTVVRSIFTLQFLLISLKLTNKLQWEWKYTLALFWLYLGVIGVYLIAYTSILILLTTLTLLGRQQNGEIDIFTQFRGLVWHCLYYCFGGFAAALIIGLNDYTLGGSTESLKLTAMVGMGLSTFLAIYTSFLVSPLTKYIQIFSLSDGAVFSSEVQGNFFEEDDENEKVKISIVREEKETYLVTLSSTYFKILSDNMGEMLKPILQNLNLTNEQKLTSSDDVIESVQNNKDIKKNVAAEVESYLRQSIVLENEDSLWYLCCERQSDAVLDVCGHGGICSDCALITLAKKSECMECRSSVNSFFKIDPKYKVANIVKSKELLKVIRG